MIQNAGMLRNKIFELIVLTKLKSYMYVTTKVEKEKATKPTNWWPKK